MTGNFGEAAPADSIALNGARGRGLGEVARLLERPEHVEGLWPQLAARIAAMLDAQDCWIVFAGASAGAGASNDRDGALRAYRSDGVVQVHDATGDSAKVHPMLEKASAMLVLHAQASPPGHGENAASPPDWHANDNALFIPIRVDDMVLGVLHVQRAARNPHFDDMHVETGQVAAFLIGKALHLDRLQKIVNSRFAQLALIGHAESETLTLRQALRAPKATAGLMAKAFYREMARAGFTPPEIIAAASEIISELTNALKRRAREP